jgi:hypothetical protein
VACPASSSLAAKEVYYPIPSSNWDQEDDFLIDALWVDEKGKV